MPVNPSIFISATSSDLHSARDLVAKVLTSLGYTPVWQDIAATDAGNLTAVLYEWIKPCAAVVQLVGFRFGAEPRQPDREFGRVSYTQLEALYAERIGRKVIYIFLPEDFPTDPCEPESEEKARLQIAYRLRLKESGLLRHNASSLLELENRILRIRDELATLRAEMEKSRRRVRSVLVTILLLLVGVTIGVWRLRQSSERQHEEIVNVRESQKEQERSLANQEKSSARIEAQLEEIRSLPANNRADRLRIALAAANAGELQLLRKAGIPPREVQTALAQRIPDGSETVAQSFFQSSRDVHDAIDWLKDMLKDGLDPNTTVPDPYFEQRAILTFALRTGNAAAAIVLLEAGASPHPYQGLWLTTNSVPIFLFPYSYLLENEALDAGEKQKVAKAMQKAGAAITRYEPGIANTKSYTGISSEREEIEKVFSRAQDVFGFELEETPPLARESHSKIADAAGKRGEPWETFLKKMPLRVVSDSRPDFGPFWFEVRNLIGVYFDRGYFLGTALDYASGPEYALIEVSKDFRTWNVYLHIGTRAGMGFAKDDNGVQSYGSSDAAWRKFDFTYFPERNEMMLSNYYKYTATRDLAGKIPYY